MVALLVCSSSADGTKQEVVPCLPANVKLEEVVSAPQLKSTTGSLAKRVTVRDTLSSLKVRCKKGKLIAANGREIRFYRLIGCWGNPPEDYQAQLERQRRELQRLKKKYRVVEIPCALGDPRLIQ